MSGSVRIARTIWDDAAFKDEPLSEREAFMWMVMEARFRAGEKRVGTVTVTLDRGQLAASTRFLAAAWQWTESRVRRYFERLKNRRMIDAATDAGITVITICKYNEYQSPDADTDAPNKIKSTQQRRTADANENKGEIREEDSEANASDGEAVGDDFAKQLFDKAVSFLGRHGTKERDARSFVGKLRKVHPDPEIFETFAACGKAGAVDPIPWITARLRRPKADLDAAFAQFLGSPQ